MRSTGLPSTWQRTRQHRKEQRLSLRMYRSHFSPPDNAPLGCIFAGRLFAVSLARHPLADGAQRVKVYTASHDPYSLLSSPLESKYHIYSGSSCRNLNTSRYVQGVRCADGVSLTREDHYSISVFSCFFYHACAAPVVYCSTRRISEGEQVNAPHGVREVHPRHAPHAWGAG